jgi:anti-sigma factor RsiW
MSHPNSSDVALFAGGELPLWKRWRVGRHLRQCPECRREVEAFSKEREWFREAAGEIPAEASWGRLAAEMKANIRVGLAAGECVGPVEPAPQPQRWRVAAALASITFVAIGGLWLHVPQPRVASSYQAGGIVLEATPVGIEVKQEDRALTLMHSGSGPVMLSVNVQGSIAARYVDDETGMVTINNVYVQ